MTKKVVRLLMVDDDEEDFLLTIIMLPMGLMEGFIIEWVSNYEGGKQHIQSHSFDIVLVEKLLDCESTLDFIHEISFTEGIPVVFYSDHDTPGMIEAVKQAGATAFINKKTVEPISFADTLRSILEK